MILGGEEKNYNGLPVCDYCVRVNRYAIVFLNMLTNIFSYGITNYKIETVKNLQFISWACYKLCRFFIIQKLISVRNLNKKIIPQKMKL